MRFQNRFKFAMVCCVCCLCFVWQIAHAATVQPPNGFDSNTTDGWIAGQSFANPSVEPNGGPQGAGDPFLKVTATGENGPGSVVAVINNGPDWVGDYKAAGITGLTVDMMNPETSNALEMRLVLFGPNTVSNRWTSVDSIPVLNDGIWRNYVFPVGEDDLTRVLGNSSYDDVLSAVARIMLRHDPGGPSVGGTSLRAELGIDNIGFLAGLTGDYNGNGQLDAGDLDLEALGIMANDLAFDLNADGVADIDDRFAWIRDLQQSWVGDANFDGEFNSSDFVAVFSIGKYELGDEATYAEGDWNGDAKFDSGDFVVAFQDGGFEQGPRVIAASVPEPSTALLLLLGVLVIVNRTRCHQPPRLGYCHLRPFDFVAFHSAKVAELSRSERRH